VSFGIILFPLLYLIGFFQRENAEGIFKSLGLILYFFGHFMNMIVLAIVSFMTRAQKLCTVKESEFIIYAMINPFTQNFFNQVLDYFICQEYTENVHRFQWIFCTGQIIVGILLFIGLIMLEERTFRKTLEANLSELSHSSD